MKSIMQADQDRCYLCEKLGAIARIWRGLETHHVFGGTANRKLSERYGLKVRLCVGHHREGPYAVQNNRKIDGILKQDAQRAFERDHSREEFMRIFGKNHLPDEEPWDPMEAGMEAAAECARAREGAPGPPPGIQMLEEAVKCTKNE